MENQFENAKFRALVGELRRIMPTTAAALLILVYAISAIAAGLFLSSPTLLGKVTGGPVLAFFIGTAIQAVRATLVFFSQLNPARPITGHQGEVIAGIMGVISIYEIYHLATAAGMQYPVVLSLSILMLAGIGIEIFLLRELKFFTEMQLFDKPEYWQKIEKYYQAKADYTARMDALSRGERITRKATAPTATVAAAAPPTIASIATGEGGAENFYLNGNGNGKH